MDSTKVIARELEELENIIRGQIKDEEEFEDFEQSQVLEGTNN